MRFFVIAYAAAVGVAFLPADLAGAALRGRGRCSSPSTPTTSGSTSEPRPTGIGGGPRAAAPPSAGPTARAGPPGTAAAADRGRPGDRGPGRDRRRRLPVRRRRSRASPDSFGADEALLALIIAPIATELPEKFNSVIWVRQGKDTLAMGNITGRDGLPERDPDLGRAHLRLVELVDQRDSLLAFASAGIAFALVRGHLPAPRPRSIPARPIAPRRRPLLRRLRRPGDRRDRAASSARRVGPLLARARRPCAERAWAADILGRRSTVAARARPRRHPNRSRRRHADREEARPPRRRARRAPVRRAPSRTSSATSRATSSRCATPRSAS